MSDSLCLSSRVLGCILSIVVAPVAWSQPTFPNWLQTEDAEEITRQLAQRDRLNRIGNLDVRFSGNGAPSWLAGDIGLVVKEGSQREIDNLLSDLAPAYLARGTERLQISSRRYIKDFNLISYRADETIRGMPVFGAQLVVTTHADTGEVLKISGVFLPDERLRSIPAQDEVRAISSSVKILQALIQEEGHKLEESRIVGTPRLGYALSGDVGRLAWQIDLLIDTDLRAGRQERLLIDAETGSLIDHFTDSTHALNRKIWNAQETTDWDKVKIRFEGEPPVGTSADTLYNFMGDTHAYFQARHFISSMWGSSDIRASINWPGSVGVAEFRHDNRALFSKGGIEEVSGIPVAASWIDRDIVAHELAHGVHLNYGNALVSLWEPGALSEAIADIMAAGVDRRSRLGSGNPDASTWAIGEIWGPVFPMCGGMRCLNNPRTVPAHQDYYPQRNPTAKVHRISTIASLAFYLTVNGGNHPRAGTGGIPTTFVPPLNSVPFLSFNLAERIFLEGFLDLTIADGFPAACLLTAFYAQQMNGSIARDNVKTAWKTVGVNCFPTADPPPQVPALAVASMFCYCWNDISWNAVPDADKYELNCATNSSFTSNVESPYFGTALRRRMNVAGNTYFRVRACNNDGCGPWKAASQIAKCLAYCY